MLALALAGCGSDDETVAESSSPTTPVTTPLSGTSTDETDTVATATTGTTEVESPATQTTPEDADEDDSSPVTRGRRRSSGSGSGSGDNSTTRRSSRRRARKVDARAQFIARGDAICADYRKNESEARKENDGRKESQVKYLSTVAALVSDAIKRLRELGAAPGDRAKFNAYVAKLVELEDHVRRFRDAIANDSRSYAEEARQVAAASAEARGLAREYGFRVCGSE